MLVKGAVMEVVNVNALSLCRPPALPLQNKDAPQAALDYEGVNGEEERAHLLEQHESQDRVRAQPRELR